ncbi:MAG TPA: CPBP family intramembrane glutamic endopeptidase [Sphingomicrobium sp.]
MASEVQVKRPRWRRIVDYPLVTLVIATVIYLFALWASVKVGKFVPPRSKIGDTAIHAAITVGFLLAAYKLIIVRLGARPKDDLPARPALRDGGTGIAIGFSIMALSVAVAAALGIYRIVGPGDTSRLLLELIAVAIIPAFTEELLFRGILFRWIEEFGGSWLALLATSALFGLAHILNPNATLFSSFAVAIEAGVLLGAAYMLTRNLWLAMGLHAGWNFTQGEIFDVPVSGFDAHGLVQAELSGPTLLSGGQFGLEASIIAIIIVTALGMGMIVLALKRGRLVHPIWVGD